MGTLWLGKVRPMTAPDAEASAIYVEDNKIIAVGQETELRKKYGQEITNVQDLVPYVIYPGFVDSHLHIMGHGVKLLRLDLSKEVTSQAMRQKLTQKVSEVQPGTWILGEGWNENNFPDRKIFRVQELDEIAPDNPMVLTRICRHAMLANTKALEFAGIHGETKDPKGGVIVKDHAGELTGLLLDQAQDLVNQVIPPIDQAELNKICRTSIEDLLSLGLVGGHTEDLNSFGTFNQVFEAFKATIDGKQIRFKANLLVQHPVLSDMKKAGYSVDEGTDYIRFGSVKIFADGALGGRTALLREPYTDAPETTGVAIQDLETLKSIVKTAREASMPVAIHTIGDLALEYAIEAIETYPVPDGRRDRIIHAQITPIDLRERLKKLPVVLDIQPQFVSSDFPWVIERLGEARLDYSFAWKTLLDEGIVCAGGSDAPIEEVNPLLGICAAVTRRKPGETHQGYLPNQKLTPYEAVKLYTFGSAYAIGKEAVRGRIAEGYEADFTVLDRDVLTVPSNEIFQAKVVMTVVDNHIVYKNEKSLNSEATGLNYSPGLK